MNTLYLFWAATIAGAMLFFLSGYLLSRLRLQMVGANASGLSAKSLERELARMREEVRRAQAREREARVELDLLRRESDERGQALRTLDQQVRDQDQELGLLRVQLDPTLAENRKTLPRFPISQDLEGRVEQLQTALDEAIEQRRLAETQAALLAEAKDEVVERAEKLGKNLQSADETIERLQRIHADQEQALASLRQTLEEEQLGRQLMAAELEAIRQAPAHGDLAKTIPQWNRSPQDLEQLTARLHTAQEEAEARTRELEELHRAGDEAERHNRVLLKRAQDLEQELIQASEEYRRREDDLENIHEKQLNRIQQDMNDLLEGQELLMRRLHDREVQLERLTDENRRLMASDRGPALIVQHGAPGSGPDPASVEPRGDDAGPRSCSPVAPEETAAASRSRLDSTPEAQVPVPLKLPAGTTMQTFLDRVVGGFSIQGAVLADDNGLPVQKSGQLSEELAAVSAHIAKVCSRTVRLLPMGEPQELLIADSEERTLSIHRIEGEDKVALLLGLFNRGKAPSNAELRKLALAPEAGAAC